MLKEIGITIEYLMRKILVGLKVYLALRSAVWVIKKLNELEKEINRIRESIDYINFKKQFYDDVISGKKEYFSYLVR